ncbi:MAG: hypothetical protein F6K26_09585 [Moorea sp. SIO2I5]|nr:hypothetical protein [Moorena sp. SIO2I5]
MLWLYLWKFFSQLAMANQFNFRHLSTGKNRKEADVRNTTTQVTSATVADGNC